jgi:hypothetical protein
VEAPLSRFIDDARVQDAVLMHPSGQVLGQAGFARSGDVMTACALVAAINASAAELGRQFGGKPFSGLHVAGRERQIFIGVAPATGGNLLLLCVFDASTSVGLVQVFFEELRSGIARAAPAPAVAGPQLGSDFEADLNRNLAALFGRH